MTRCRTNADFSPHQRQHGSAWKRSSRTLTLMIALDQQHARRRGAMIRGVGSLERIRRPGCSKRREISNEMLRPSRWRAVPADASPLLPQYPAMFNEFSLADTDMSARSMPAALPSPCSTSRSTTWTISSRISPRHDRLQRRHHEEHYNSLDPQMQRPARVQQRGHGGSQAAQLYNLARSRQLSARITLLGLGTSPSA